MPGVSVPPSEVSAGLLARIARGDREAFGRFYDAFAGLALGLIRRILRDPAAAEEVLQEVFWQIWREAARYDPRRGSLRRGSSCAPRPEQSTGCVPCVEEKRPSWPLSTRRWRARSICPPRIQG